MVPVNDNLSPDQFDYRMSHRPGSPEGSTPFHNADEVMPDVTGPKGPQYYDSHNVVYDESLGRGRRIPHSQSPSAESFRQMRAAKGNPEAEVHIYRAVPKAEHGIQPGDWVATSRKYAEMHKASNGEPDWAVVHKTAKASEVYGDGDDPNEWGYHPS
jgi:hypothetical protein